MNRDVQRIAIAEACGWRILAMTEAVKLSLYKPGHLTDPSKWQLLYDPQNRCKAGTQHRAPMWGTWVNVIPDYFNDLNAMHEAENSLTDAQYDTFCQHVYRIVAADTGRPERRYGINATAAQRAEAFLRTIGKWQD